MILSVQPELSLIVVMLVKWLPGLSGRDDNEKGSGIGEIHKLACGRADELLEGFCEIVFAVVDRCARTARREWTDVENFAHPWNSPEQVLERNLMDLSPLPRF